MVKIGTSHSVSVSVSGVKTPFPIQINRIRPDSGAVLPNSKKIHTHDELHHTRVTMFDDTKLVTVLTFGP